MRGAVSWKPGEAMPGSSMVNEQRRSVPDRLQPPKLSWRPRPNRLPPDQLVSQVPEATVAVGGMPERMSTLPHRLLFSGWLLATEASRVEALGRKRAPHALSEVVVR